MEKDNHHNTALEPSQGVLTRARLKAAVAAAELARLDIPLSIATCMAESRFGEAVGCLVLMSRAFYSDTQLWGAFKEHQGPKGRTRLMYAARKGNVARARFLLDRGARMDVCTQWNEDDRPSCGTALMFASRRGHLEIVRLLLTSGADKAALNHAGRTAHSRCAAHPAIRALLA